MAASPSAASVRVRLLGLCAPLLIAFILALTFTLWPQTLFAGTITVDGTTCTLPNAISAANTDGTVGGCTITGTPGEDTLLLTAASYSVVQNSSFNSGSDGDVNATPSVSTKMIISSTLEGGSIVQRTGGNARLFHVGTNGNLILRGVTVQNGNSGSSHGGAIFNRGHATLIDSKLLTNVASRGGGLYNTGTVTFTNVMIYNNRATSHGGGLFNNNDGKQATLINTQVISNSATSNGGGIYNNSSGSTVTLTNTQVLTNSGANGGGLYINSGSSKLYMTNSAVGSNRATATGGAVYINTDSSVAITNTQIFSNSAVSHGGGFFLNSSTSLIMTETVISGNRSGSVGGGIYSLLNSATTIILTNGMVFSNTAVSNGGGIYNGNKLTLTNTDVISNSSQAQGGGIYSGNDGTTTLVDSDVIKNRAGTKGGGIYSLNVTKLTNSHVLTNTSLDEGGGIFIGTSGNSNVTLIDSDVTGNYATKNGGGIYSFGSVTLTNSDVLSNTSLGKGGGIYAENTGSSDVTLNNSDVTGNYAASDGGGIYAFKATSLTDSDLISNTSLGSGGGIFNDNTSSSHVALTNANVRDNYAAIDGGALYIGNTTTLNNADVVSNTALGSGGGLYILATGSSNASLTSSDVTSNYAGNHGGGLYSGNTATLNNSHVMSNTALGSGGGIYNNGPATLINANVIGNVASNRGGGIFNSGGSSANLTGSPLIANHAGSDGGGIYVNSTSTAALENSSVLSNTASGRGGGVFNNVNGQISFTELAIQANTSITNGGGINNNGIATFTNADVVSNTASLDGGGIYNNHTVSLDHVQVISNTTTRNGGGIYNTMTSTNTMSLVDVVANSAGGTGGGIHNNGVLTVTAASLIANQAGLDGGGLFQSHGQSKITQARIIENRADGSGGGVQFALGIGTVNDSCIVNNSDISLDNLTNGTINAVNNWWGAVDGPSGAGLGAGDSISNSVSYIPFESSALFDCSSRSSDVVISKSVAPAADLLPGQPLTFTVIITNNDTLGAHNLHMTDLLPAAFQLSEVISTGTVISAEVGGFHLPNLEGGASAILHLRGTVSTTLSADQQFTNTATVSNTLTGLLSATASANVKVPVLRWSQANYFAAEESGLYTATVLISPANPYADVTTSVTTPTLGILTLTAGANSLAVGVPIEDDAIVLARTIPLGLQSALGAAIDDQGGDQATLVLIEDDAAPALAVVKRANTTHAYVGETITYTYQITNTGNVTVNVEAAVDDKFGALAGLLGELDLLASRTVTLTHLVELGDLPSPLVNTVTLTATDLFTHEITPTATATVDISEAAPDLVVVKRANTAHAYVGETITYTYRISNTGNITLTVTHAEDDQLGALAGLIGQLGILASRSVTLTYLVQASDLPGPLEYTVSVMAEDHLGNNLGRDDSASVTLAAPTALFTKRAFPAGNLLPGQPVTYTLTVTNTEPTTLYNLVIHDPLPTHFVLNNVQTSGPTVVVDGDNYTIAQMAGAQVATIHLIGAVDSAPTNDFVLTNAATLNHAILGELHASTSNNVVVPRVQWSESDYTVNETSEGFTATLLMSPANPHAAVSVSVLVTDSSPATFQAVAAQTITFPPNSTSQPVEVNFANDGVVVTRTIRLLLQTLSGAALGEGASGSAATIHVIEANATPAIVVTASADTARASVGQTITYLYQITNTGNVTLATISALQDAVDAVDDLAGLLAPNATRTASVTHLVVEGDLPGPRVTTLDVTATDIFGTVVTDNTSTTVAINDPTALPDTEQPHEPNRALYLPNLFGN